jgi:diaminopimelate epimerase
VSAPQGTGELRFYKLSGSGNDFVFFDARTGLPEFAGDPAAVAALCARGEGVGADGVVFLDTPEAGVVRIVYLNSDGSRAALCGNATLCTVRLAAHLGLVTPGESFVIQTDAGRFRAHLDPTGAPAFELTRVRALVAEVADVSLAGEGAGAELRIGYAVAGVPHLVVKVVDVDGVDVMGRGRALRAATSERAEGANVNFVSPGPDGGWRMRTFERGVEGETLACGTGAIACAAVLQVWGDAGDVIRIVTRSGREVTVSQPGDSRDGPTLSGEGRLVYEGVLHSWR